MSILDVEKAHRPTIDQTLFAELLLLVKAEHDQASIYLSNESLVRTTVDHYNAMVLQAEDPADHEELKSLVPWAHRRIKRLIAAAKAEPGTGKRSAS